MSNDQKAISLDFYQWGVLIGADLDRLKNFVNNFTMNSHQFGPVNAGVVAEFQDHLDAMKRMAVAWGVASQKETIASPSQRPVAPQSSTKASQLELSSTSTNGVGEIQKKRRGRPPKIKDEKRVRLSPN
jgi:hypothetical protein